MLPWLAILGTTLAKVGASKLAGKDARQSLHTDQLIQNAQRSGGSTQLAGVYRGLNEIDRQESAAVGDALASGVGMWANMKAAEGAKTAAAQKAASAREYDGGPFATADIDLEHDTGPLRRGYRMGFRR